MRVPILLYHYIGDCPPEHDDPYRPDLWVSEARFAQQLRYLNEHGYATVSLDWLFAPEADEEIAPGKRPVVLTFDDGTDDNYQRAFPLLRAAGCVATFFVVTDLVGTPGYMTWDQLREMAAAGMAIESHTATHADLNQLSPAARRAELRRSRATLERQLGRPARYLAYPGGHYNAAACADARQAGYRAAVTTLDAISFGPGAAFELPRVRVSSSFGLDEFGRCLVVDRRSAYERQRLLRRHNLWKAWKRVRKQGRRLKTSVRRLAPAWSL